MSEPIIRPAKYTDLDAVLALGMEALNDNPIPGLIVSRERARDLGVTCISGPQHYCGVCEVDGEIVGAVTAYVHDMMFHERKQASVIQFYCKVPGQGVRLLRDFMAWVQTRPVIKMVVFTLESDADPRIGLLLKRLGNWESHPVYLYTK